MKFLDWKSCYKESGKNLWVPLAYTHPAKMSVGLCRKIFAFMEEKGMLKKGNVVCDPFAGIFTTGLIGAMKGYRVVGVELEEKFCKLSKQNIEKNHKILERLGVPIPEIYQADSRKLSEVIAFRQAVDLFGLLLHPLGDVVVQFRPDEFHPTRQLVLEDHQTQFLARCVQKVEGIVTSPPFSMANCQPVSSTVLGSGQGVRSKYKEIGKRPDDNLGGTKGQIAILKEGSISAVLTSPPYADTPTSAQNVGNTIKKNWGKGRRLVDDKEPNYGMEVGQIGSLKDKGIDAVITSPPYAEIRQDGGSTRPGYTGMTPYSGEPRNAWRTTRNQENIGNVPEGDVDSVIGGTTCDTVKIVGNQLVPKVDGARNVIDTTSGGRESPRQKNISGRSDLDISTSQIRCTTPTKTRIGKVEMRGGGDSRGESKDVKHSPTTTINAENVEHESISLSITRKTKPKQEGSGTTRLKTLKHSVEPVTTSITARTKESTELNAKFVATITLVEARFQEPAPVSAGQNSTQPSTENGFKRNEPPTYWSEMAKIYLECWKILKPNGYMAITVKDFVRAKKRVPLCDNTVKLLEHLGFKVEYRARAWLTEDLGTPDAFTGRTKSKQRKSFFRRLAESKGSPRIDWEEVLICQKI